MDLSNTLNRQFHNPSIPEAEAAHGAMLTAKLDRLRAAYAANRMPSVDWRRRQLARLETMLRNNIEEICVAIAADFGHRSHHETQLLELFPAITAIKHARRHVGAWMKPRRSWASMWFLPARNEIRPQPLGVVGIIVPWNYPILLAVSPLVAALAAGN